MMAKTRNTQSKRSPIVMWVGLICVIAFVASVGSFAAKYVSHKESDSLAEAKSFYLESDLLVPSSETTPRYTLQAGIDTISLKLMNYPDNLRTSDVDITCKVTLSKDGNSDDDTNSVDVALDKNVQDIEEVSFTNLDPGTYLVTVGETSPYATTLQAYFTVVGLTSDVSYKVSDAANSPNLLVTISTVDYEGDVTVKWPADVLPDNSDPLLVGATGSPHVIRVEKNSKYTLQFFKPNPAETYVDENFAVAKKTN